MENIAVKGIITTGTDEYFNQLEKEFRVKIQESDCPLTFEEIYHHASMLMCHRKHGAVTYNDFSHYMIEEVLDDPNIEQVFQFLEANCYESYYENVPSVFNDMLQGRDAQSIASGVYRGGYRPQDDWFWLEWEDICSCNTRTILDKYDDDTKRYLFETSSYDSYENGEELENIDACSELIIELCNRMLRDCH